MKFRGSRTGEDEPAAARSISWHGFSTRVLETEARVGNPCHVKEKTWARRPWHERNDGSERADQSSRTGLREERQSDHRADRSPADPVLVFALRDQLPRSHQR